MASNAAPTAETAVTARRNPEVFACPRPGCGKTFTRVRFDFPPLHSLLSGSGLHPVDHPVRSSLTAIGGIAEAKPHEAHEAPRWTKRVCLPGERVRDHAALPVPRPALVQASGCTDAGCNRCGASFARKADLQVHTLRHSEERPFVCSSPGCGKVSHVSRLRPIDCPHSRPGSSADTALPLVAHPADCPLSRRRFCGSRS